MVLHCCSSISIQIQKPLLTLTNRRKPKPKFSCFVVPNIGVDDIAQLAHNKVLVAAAASAAIGQLSKPFTSVLFYGKDFDFKTAFQAGGFPSTHSSSVVAAATSLALERGFSDSIFGVTLVYAGLVMYDAQGVRREVGNHAKVLNAILAKRRINSIVSNDRDNSIDSQEETSKSSGNYDELGPILSKKSRSLASKTVNLSLLIASDKETRQSFEFSGDDREVLDQIQLKESIGHTEVEVVAGGLLGFIYCLFSGSYHASADDTLAPNQSISNGRTLVSSAQTFELGFFSPAKNPIAVLLDSGNLVVKEDSADEDTENYLWESFDSPSDTQLEGMKIGRNFETGVNRYLTAWKDVNDPSPGDFTYGVDDIGSPQFVVREGTKKRFRTGPWNGVKFNGHPLQISPIINHVIVYNTEEAYDMFEVMDKSVISRTTLNESGLVQRLVLYENADEWTVMYTLQNDLCNDYAQCGPNGICKINQRPICECLEGFVPRSEREWQVLNWTSGCVRRTPLDCQKREGFLKIKNVKLPDLLEFKLDRSMNLRDCRAECLKNCSCTAYANSNYDGHGCLMWFGNLLDIREFIEEQREQDIYIRVPASEIRTGDSIWKSRRTVIIVVSAMLSGLLVLVLACWYTILKYRKKKKESQASKEDLELPLFDFVAIASATNNFSDSNKIGTGGFGLVYKGEIFKGQEIAVKRLSSNSQQGVEQFKNEVAMISKLQHRNLVRLLGCCIKRDERMLIYEFMPNRSLNYFIFDETRRKLLTWPKRFEIIMGISRGLLYLHQDSRLRIIHRDLKASNVLLDSELNPKISDFGIAKMFGGDQVEAKTKRVVGTYGYMSPEYAIDGKFSVKSDVYSFGVLLLEIVSGKRNRGFNHPDHYHNLLGHAWLLWNDGNALELMDRCLEDSCAEAQVLRCIQVGLLCVQKHVSDRPTMSSVVRMLGNEEITTLPSPNEPGFYVERSSADTNALGLHTETSTENEVTLTLEEGR